MNLSNTNVLARYDKSVTLREQLRMSGLQRFLDQADSGVTDVVVNEPGVVFTESVVGRIRHEVPQATLALLRELANSASIFSGGTPLDLRSPIKNVRLPDGQRGIVVIPPACPENTVSLAFRLGGGARFSLDEYLATGRLNNFRDVSVFRSVPEGVHLQDFELEILQAKAARDMKRFFKLCVDHNLNVCISGGTGSGKTTFMKALSDLVPADTRIITIEDVHELSLPHHENKVHLFYGDFVSAKEAVKACMRMKPDRIFLTELRGDEAFDYIAALNTGHPGSLTTTHANSPLAAYHRIATLIKQSEVGQSLEWANLYRQVATSIDVMLQFSRTRMIELYYDPVRRAKMMRGDTDV
jgi:type IV secretion system protein VirB11